MGKFSRNLDSDLESKVRSLAKEVGVSTYVDVEPIALKSKKEVGCVVKGNELVALFTNNDSIVCVAINQDAFSRVDSETQDVWIMGLLNQIHYDMDKDKITIEKPELQIDLGLYRKLGDVAVKKAELAILTLQQMIDEEEEAKEAKKSKKKKN